MFQLQLDATAATRVGGENDGVVGGRRIDSESQKVGEGDLDLRLVETSGEIGGSGEGELEAARSGDLLGVGSDGAKGVGEVEVGALEVEGLSKGNEFGSELSQAGRFGVDNIQ